MSVDEACVMFTVQIKVLLKLPVILHVQIIKYSLNERSFHYKIFYDELGCSFNPNKGNQLN